jgi:hypothetical protein
MLHDFEPIRRDQLGWRARADVLAAALVTTGGNDRQGGGTATISGEVGLGATADCDLVAAGGQLAARSDDRVASAQQWASICPLGGDGNLTIDHHLEWDVSPRLLAAPRLRPGLQRRETIGLNVFGSIRPLDDRKPTLLPERDWQQGGTLRLELQFGWSPPNTGNTTGEVHPLLDAVLANFRHDYGDDGPSLEIAAITAGLEAMVVSGDPAAPFVASLSSDLGRIEGLRVGGVRLGARLAGRLAPEASGKEKPYHQQLWVIGEGGLSIERDLAHNLTMRLAGDRQGWPTWDGRFVVDDRATWSLLGRHGRLSGRIDAAAASTHVLQMDGRHDVATGGVTAESELGLEKGLGLKLRSELGRSVYAAGATLDEPRWASETLLMLAAHARR